MWLESKVVLRVELVETLQSGTEDELVVDTALGEISIEVWLLNYLFWKDCTTRTG